MLGFSNLSETITKQLTKKEKHNDGIYFTPPKTIVECLNLISRHRGESWKAQHILEPSCGSCEFIEKARVCYPSASITGVEYNKTVFENIKNNYANRDATDVGIIRIIEGDFLKTAFHEKFDLIIGNPPYYVLPKADVDKRYYAYFDGRPNIFLLFIIKSMTLLADDGILCFILPKSFLNCLYYNKTRKHIYDNYTILSIQECDDDYIDTEQQTIIFIIQKKKEKESITEGIADNNKDYIVDSIGITDNLSNQYTIFATRKVITRLNELYIHATTLHALGFKVSVGNIVWNQHKELLTDDTQKTRLIYSSDIKNNTLSIKEYTNTDKKNYIDKSGFNEPLFVVNRGYGVGNYNFEYSLINCDAADADYIREYLIENHLICIRYGGGGSDFLIDKYKRLYASFGDERTAEFIKLYFGNNAINTTELSYILPIYGYE
jgi:adenine-specific DNA-methyltransferase